MMTAFLRGGWFCSSTVALLAALAARPLRADLVLYDFAGPQPDSGGVMVRGINNHGDVFGVVFDGEFNERGFLRLADGTLAPFDLPNGAATERFQTQLGAVNDDGLIAGYLPTTRGAHGNPLLLFRDGAVTATIPLPDEFGTTGVRGLNNAGVIAGTVNDLVAHKPRGFIRDAAGNFTKFDVNATTLFTEVEGINNSGVVLGNYSIFNAFTQGFERTPDGQIHLLDTPERIGGKTVFAIFYAAINDAGFVVGSFQDPDTQFFGFIRDPAGNFTLVQNPRNLASTGLTGINRHGTVCGTYLDEHSEPRSFVGEPCPADIDRDGDIGLADLSTLLIHFGALDGATNATGDLDADGAVGLRDLATLLSQFGASCPSGPD